MRYYTIYNRTQNSNYRLGTRMLFLIFTKLFYSHILFDFPLFIQYLTHYCLVILYIKEGLHQAFSAWPDARFLPPKVGRLTSILHFLHSTEMTAPTRLTSVHSSITPLAKLANEPELELNCYTLHFVTATLIVESCKHARMHTHTYEIAVDIMTHVGDYVSSIMSHYSCVLFNCQSFSKKSRIMCGSLV